MKIGGGQLEEVKRAFREKERTFDIPLNEVRIYHKDRAELCSYGGVFENGKVINESLNSSNPATYQQDFYDYINSLCLFKINSKRYLKDYLKKFYFSKLSFSAYKTRAILQDSTKPKIIFFCAWFSNMYHFVFEAYSRLLILLDYAREHKLDFYILAPPRYRGLSKYHTWFINDILELEGIARDRILYLDYQNYDINNIYFCSNPQCNEKYILPAINKLKEHFRDEGFKGYERVYISRSKSPRRFLSNEDEIASILESRYGFKKIYMEDYNLKDKINIMMNAKIVLSIDGTSIVNGLFMDSEDSKIIALRSADMTDHLLFLCASMQNIAFLPIICDVILDDGSILKADDILESKLDKRLWVEGNLYLEKEYLIKKLREYEVDELS